MLFFSFCRGKLGDTRANRTSESWECTTLRRKAKVMEYNPVRRGVADKVLEDERNRHPFPSVEVPINCYICFSTLPDSKSLRYNPITRQRNWMFEGLSEYLAGIYKINTRVQAASTTEAIAPEDQAVSVDYVKHADLSAAQFSVVAVPQQLPRVELVSLLTDLSGLVREKSEFTQYLNYCYKLTKKTNPVILEILPGIPDQ